MPKYKVRVKEEHFQEVFVEAVDQACAVMAVREGEGNYGACEFHTTCDSNEWEVEEVCNG